MVGTTVVGGEGAGVINDPDVVHRLAAGLGAPVSVDEVAVTTLRTVTRLTGVVRAALALSVVGGRELRFLSSDPGRLGPPPQWCLIDAYHNLPLNDAVRSGCDVVLTTPEDIRDAYPGLAVRQSGTDVRSLVALALRAGEQRIGGLLLYGDRDFPAPGHRPGVPPAELTRVADLVTGALGAVRAAAVAAGSTLATPDLPLHRRLPGDATAPGAARSFLREALTGPHVDDETLDAALLCASELVTNVVMHAGRESVISVEPGAASVTVQVRHAPAGGDGPGRVAAEDDPLPIAGRGLVLVDALASDWGSETTGVVTCVWFRLRLPETARA